MELCQKSVVNRRLNSLRTTHNIYVEKYLDTSMSISVYHHLSIYLPTDHSFSNERKEDDQ